MTNKEAFSAILAGVAARNIFKIFKKHFNPTKQKQEYVYNNTQQNLADDSNSEECPIEVGYSGEAPLECSNE